MALFTLDRMAMRGIYDHLGGGFHRYSTDEHWLAPHFEKMLYDNALLTVAYLETYQATGEPLYREVVEETLGYVLREMTSPEGPLDRKSTRLNSSHITISYAVFCLKKK